MARAVKEMKIKENQ